MLTPICYLPGSITQPQYRTGLETACWFDSPSELISFREMMTFFLAANHCFLGDYLTVHNIRKHKITFIWYEIANSLP